MKQQIKILVATMIVLVMVKPGPLTMAMSTHAVLPGTPQLEDVQSSAGYNWIKRAPESFPSPRSGHAMAYDSARGVTVLFGGSDDKGKFSDTWEWDGTAWTKRTPVNSPPALVYSAMVYDSARGVTVLFGGYTTVSYSGTWEWNGTDWTHRFPVNNPPARSRHAMAYDSVREVTTLFGGYTISSGGTITPFDDTWEWDGTDWIQRSSANVPNGRYYHALAYDSARQATVLFGGNGYPVSSYLNDTWEWDGINWSQSAPINSPPVQAGHAMAYDSTRQVTVLYGSKFSDNTWEWDGINWSQRITADSPSIRSYHTLAYDSARDVTVLFGGYYSYSVGGTQYRVWYGETWEYVVSPMQQIYLPLVLRTTP